MAKKDHRIYWKNYSALQAWQVPPRGARSLAPVEIIFVKVGAKSAKKALLLWKKSLLGRKLTSVCCVWSGSSHGAHFWQKRPKFHISLTNAKFWSVTFVWTLDLNPLFRIYVAFLQLKTIELEIAGLLMINHSYRPTLKTGYSHLQVYPGAHPVLRPCLKRGDSINASYK